MKRRLLSSFLALCMALTMAPVAFAVDDTEESAAEPEAVTSDAGAANAIEPQNADVPVTLSEDAASELKRVFTNGGTIQLDKNVTISSQLEVASGKDVTLDLNGHTLTLEATKVSKQINVKGILTIKDSGENGKIYCGVNFTGTGSLYAIYVPSGGKLTIASGIIDFAGQMDEKKDGIAVGASTTGEVVLAGGTIQIDDRKGNYAVKTESPSTTFKMTGGEIIAEGDATCIYNSSTSNIAISGGKITASKTAEDTDSMDSKAIRAVKAGAKVAITGGEFTGVVSVVDGSISGGKFDRKIPIAACAAGLIPVDNGNGTYSISTKKYTAAIGENGYETLQTAVDTAQSGDAIDLLMDTEIEKTVVVSGKTITLSMNGHTISNTKELYNETTGDWSLISVRNSGDLTITGNGTLKAKENDGFAVDAWDGNLTIENGTFVGNSSAVYLQKGIANIKGGTYSIQQLAPGYNDYRFVLNLWDTNCKNGTAKMIVTGGTFVKFNPANCEAEGEGTNFCAEGYGTVKTGDTYKVIAVSGAAAAINGSYFEKLSSAITAAQDGDTIKLLKDGTVSTLKDGVTYDLNGHTMTCTETKAFEYDSKVMSFVDSSVQGTQRGGTLKFTNLKSATAALWPKDGATLNVSNLYVSSGGSAFYPAGTATAVNVTSCDVAAAVYGVGTNGSSAANYGVVITLKDSKFVIESSDGDNTPVYINVPGTLNIENCEIRGQRQGVMVRTGTASIKNSTITTTGKFAVKDEFYSGEWGSGNDVPAAAMVVGSYASGESAYKGDAIVMVENTKLIGENNFPALYVDGNTAYKGDVSISGENTAVTGAIMKGQQQVAGAVNISITGGYFTTDPTDYLATGYVAVTSDKPGYDYMVEKKTETGSIEVKTDVEEPVVDANAIPEAKRQEVADAVKEIQAPTLGAAATAQAQTINAEKAEALRNQVTDPDVNKATANLYVQTALSVKPTEYNDADGAKKLTVDITPQYRIVASTAMDADDIALTGTGKNAQVVQDYQPITLTAPTEITMVLPNGFAENGDELSVKHTHDGKVEYYTGTVNGAGVTQAVTFTTNGFSTFEISEAAAKISGTAYPTLAEAVANVLDGQTIELVNDIATTDVATVSKTIRFQVVNASSKNFDKDKNIVAGSNTTVKVSGENSPYTYEFTYSRPSSGSGSTSTTYAVNVNATTNGTVAADKKTAAKGTTVTVTATPSAGYVVDAVKVVDKDGKDVAVTAKDGKYSFVMPASAVTVTATFKAETPAPSGLPFVDVKSGDWFYDAVKYAYEQGLMTGTSATTFAPNGTMNRAMIVTVLYRLEKSPAVTAAAKFTDVPAGQWYSDAVAWAAANSIVNGYNETTFGPMNAVTREQMAAILFRYEQYKGMETVTLEENLNRFPDKDKISAYAVPALQWAVGQKVINGNADGTLNPTGTATRAQVAQIFTNLLNK